MVMTAKNKLNDNIRHKLPLEPTDVVCFTQK